MTEGSKGEPVQAAGERFAYIGVVVVDGEGNIADHYLVETGKLGSDSKVTESSARILERVGDTPAIGSVATAATSKTASKAAAKSSAKAGEGASAEATTEEAVKAATEAVIEAATEAAESKKAETEAADTKKAATKATESKKAAGTTDTKAEPVKEETEARAEDTKKEETKAEADDKQTEAAKKEDTKAEEKKDDAGDDSVGNNDGEYEVVKGDCLWNIARDRLGDGTRWVEIYELNKGIISNPSLIYVGQQLVLPPG
ncbi:MAG: LysM peptidoglycan-binding domain-containing protein [Lachnospiraceae bacterium]|nr:LysM peptidoglycan-binding domain-containing protein [Lachnospiraceae bacterium]